MSVNETLRLSHRSEEVLKDACTRVEESEQICIESGIVLTKSRKASKIVSNNRLKEFGRVLNLSA